MRMIDADAFLADESEAYMKAQIEIAKRTADKTITAERYINQLVHKKIQMLIADAPTIEPKTKVVAQVTFDEEKLREIVKEAVERFKEEYEIEPKRGEWIDDDFVGQYRCSECDYYAIDEYDYCPNCGARMRPRLQGKRFDSIIIDESAMKGTGDDL